MGRPELLSTWLGGRNEKSSPERTAAPILAPTRRARRCPDRPGPVSARPPPESIFGFWIRQVLNSAGLVYVLPIGFIPSRFRANFQDRFVCNLGRCKKHHAVIERTESTLGGKQGFELDRMSLTIIALYFSSKQKQRDPPQDTKGR